MKKRMHQFLTALLWLIMPEACLTRQRQDGRRKPARRGGTEESTVCAGAAGYKTRRSRPGIVMKELYNNKYDSATMSQQQCILLIQAVSRILREEAEKKDLSFSLEVKPKEPE